MIYSDKNTKIYRVYQNFGNGRISRKQSIFEKKSFKLVSFKKIYSLITSV